MTGDTPGSDTADNEPGGREPGGATQAGAGSRPELPRRAQVVIIGGGVIGTSVAYHLTLRGITDVLLLEQGQLSCGTTWHAAGLVGQLRASESGTRLVQYSTQLYEQLEEETGLATGFRRCGGVTVARTPDRMMALRRTAATAEAFGIECELISPQRAGEMYPIMDVSDLLGALWLPGDGRANPTDLTAALARGARMRGAVIRERTRVTGIAVTDGTHRSVTGVRTDEGDVEAGIVINCAGQWAKQVGAMCGVTVPLHSAEHFYVVTDQVAGVHRDYPVLRDPDGYTYIKEEVGGLLVGGFEPDAKPWVSPDQLPYPFEFALLEEDWDHFAILMDSAIRRIPALASTGMKKLYNGPESFTPDNQFILGEAPELRNFYVAAGFNSVGIASAGGVGKALADWIVDGDPGTDMSVVDIRRFAAFNGNNRWLRDRVGEVLGLHYAAPWPNRELVTARPFRRSPAYHLLRDAGACFGSKMGWERANVFAPDGQLVEYSWDKPNWLAWSAAEQQATRETVAVYDQTSFSKYLVSGPEAVTALQWLCTADVDVRPGRTVYTGMLNAGGRYEADVTVTRLAQEEFLIFSSAASTERDLDHIRRRLPAAGASVVDVTSAYAVYGVMGPRSRELLSALTTADLSNEGFGFGTSRLIDLGYATVRATRLTYVGELGWELCVPAEFAVGVYEDLMAAGAGLGVVNAGYYAIESLRLEKGYRAFGRELTPDYNPVEAGLLFACKLKTPVGFLGRQAVEQARKAGPRQRLVSVVVTDPDAMAWGGELLLRDGVAAGLVTSAAWGATIGAPVAMAYVRDPAGDVVTPDYVRTGSYQVNIGGRVCPARVTLRPPFDPDGEKVHR
jgi:glycine cleavage system aminomethyltransferase T/glycine/D-amino acid oxidase-like deaminating enzyme